LCIISHLAAWTAKIHNIINNGLLGLSLTTIVRHTFLQPHGCCARNQNGSQRWSHSRCLLTLSLHYTFSAWVPLILVIFNFPSAHTSVVLNLHIYSCRSYSWALFPSLFLGFTHLHS
jgi:hypothetical protein